MASPKFLLITVLLALAVPSARAAEVSLQDGVASLVSTDPTLVFVGENHKTTGLARSVSALVTELRKHAAFDCVFLELPSDRKKELTTAIESGRLSAVSRVVVDAKIEPTLEAYRRLGWSEAKLEAAAKIWRANPAAVLATYPIDQGFIDLVRREKISVIPYDSETTDPETFDSLYYSLAREADPASVDLIMKAIASFDARSRLMGENIRASMREQSCSRGVIVVGYAHLYESKVLSVPLGRAVELSPLQRLLESEGLDSKVVIAESVVDGEPRLLFEASERFANYEGRLLSPNRK